MKQLVQQGNAAVWQKSVDEINVAGGALANVPFPMLPPMLPPLSLV